MPMEIKAGNFITASHDGRQTKYQRQCSQSRTAYRQNTRMVV